MPPKLTSSTARDVAAGRPSELDAISGAAVRAAQRLGVRAPALEALLAAAEDACRAPSR
jgi:2-dehydropantoate 2-reductase